MSVIPVLYFEDNPHAAEIVTAALVTIGVQVYVTADGHNALEIAQQIQPQLILTDLRLPPPSISGCEIIALFKQHNQWQHLPIIVITASGKEYLQRAVEAGCNNYLEKPFPLSDLRNIVAHELHMVS